MLHARAVLGMEEHHLGPLKFHSFLPDVVRVKLNGRMVVKITAVEIDENIFLTLKRKERVD